MYRTTEIEDAILATLRADAALAAYVRLFTPIPSLQEESLEKLIVQFPAIGAVASSGSYDYLSARPRGIQVETGLFAVLCFNRNLRSPVAAMRGGTATEKGVSEMIEDCRRILSKGLYQDDGSGGLTVMNVASCLPRRWTILFGGDPYPFAAASLEVEIKWDNQMK
jgi:phage gp37-like protein